MSAGAAVRVVRPLDGDFPPAPSTRTARTGHVISSSVPTPPKPLAAERYPWGELQVGESFFVESQRERRMHSSYTAQQKYPGRKFRAEWTPHDPVACVAGLRVWRTA